MADKSHIEWTDATWNPVTGCSIVSPGCTNCYAMKLAGTRLKHHPSRAGLTHEVNGNHVWTGEVRLNEQWLTQPLTWKRPRTVFVCAHGDLFHESVPDEWIDKVFAVMALAPQHTFQVLTKRAARMRAYLNSCKTDGICWQINNLLGRSIDDERTTRNEWRDRIQSPLPNVWLGVSAERQQEADARIPDLLATPAAVRFVSAEPLLGPIRFDHINGTACLASPKSCCRGKTYVDSLRGIQACERAGAFNYPDQYLRGTRLDWIIVGGESGDGARPMHPDWARSIRDQCIAAGVPFFFKQWGAWASDHEVPAPENVIGRLIANDGRDVTEKWLDSDLAMMMWRVGKARAGRLLDGREWNEMPNAKSEHPA